MDINQIIERLNYLSVAVADLQGVLPPAAATYP